MPGEQINPWIYTCLVVHLIFNIRASTSILNLNTRGFCMVSFSSRLVMFSWKKTFFQASHCKLGFVIIFYYCNRTHWFLVKIVLTFTSLCKIRQIEVEITISCVGLFIYCLFVFLSLPNQSSILKCYLHFIFFYSVFCPITHTL